MNIVITGITGMRNRGVEAIVVPTIEQLRQRHSEIGITILTRSPDYDAVRLSGRDVDLKPEAIHSRAVPKSRKRQLAEKLLPFTRSLSPATSPSVFRQSSAVIASGGDVFSPEYNISPHLQPLKLALAAGTPLIFLAQSISPYKTDEQAQLWLEIARQAKLITVREQPTYRYLTEVLGLSHELVKLTADPAFLLPPLPEEQVNQMLQSYGVSRERPLVAIAVSQGICSFGSGCDYTKHLEAWQKTIAALLDEFNAEILVIPHVQEISPKNDDRILATELLRAFNYDPRIHVVSGDHTASEFKGAIGACDLVIAERMHAAIAGLSSGVCTVAIGYSVKAEGIMSDLVGSELLQQGLLISLENFLEPNVARQAIRSAWEKRQEVALRLQEELPSVRSRAASNFDLILKALN